MPYSFLLLVFLSLPVLADPAASTYKSHAGDTGTVTFLAIAQPGNLKIEGKALAPEDFQWNLTLSPQGLEGRATVKLTALKTGMQLRDTHMNKALETSKFPEAEFTFNKVAFPTRNLASQTWQENELPFEGTMKLHGVSNKISGTAKVSKTFKSLVWESEFDLKLGEYGIIPPKFMGLSVQPGVHVTVKFTSNQ